MDFIGFMEKRMTLEKLYQIICDRRDNPQQESYTTHLIAEGEDEILKKIGEETMEVIIAAKGQGKQRLIEELSDLAYHSLVLLAYRGIKPLDIQTELEKRHKK